MSEDLNLKGRVTLDTSDSEQALGRVEGGAVRMAQTVQQAGQRAQKGVSAVGDGAAPAAQKLEGAARSIASSIQRTTAAMDAGERGTRKFYEALAAQRGVNVDALKPYLDQLEAVKAKQDAANAALQAQSTAMGGTATSAKQLQFALRGVPAQFTDIVTSIAGGQRPMQVLIQQGGQLKDMFGGIGPAARALGGYIVGLVNPLTIGAAAIAGLAVAAHEGSEELRGFQNAATITGNAIGLTNSRFGELRDAVAGIAGTKGKAAEALTAIAQSGLVAGDNVRSIAEAAILMEKATGQAVAKTVEQFKELQRSPADAAAKLNEQYNFLTGSIYRQIKALEDQGRAQDAANLAERTYADALKTRAQAVVDNTGFIEKAWRGVTGAAKGAWDAMLGVGRQVTNAEQIALLQRGLADRQQRNRSLGIGDANGDSAMTQETKLQIDLLRENERMERKLAESQADRARLAQTTAEWEKRGEQFKDNAAHREEELKRTRIEGQQLVAAGIITEKELTERLVAIRKKYNETTGEGGIASQRAAKEIARQENARLQASIDSMDFSTPTKLTDAERKVIQINEELKGSLLGVGRANKEKELSAAKAAVQDEKTNQLLHQQADSVKKAREEIIRQADAVGQQADSIQQQAIAQEAANAQFGKSKTAIEETTLAHLRLQLAEADSSDTFDPRYVAGLRAKTEAQVRFVEALQKTEFLQKSRSLDEAARVAGEESQTLQLEVSLLGRTQQEREKIIAQRRVEVALAKELSEIDKLNLGDGPDVPAKRQELKDKARSVARVQAANAEQKTIGDEWQRTADSINSSLTDALLRGFESGKGFAKNFKDTLKNVFSSMVLKPIIQAVMAPVSGAITGIAQGVGSSIVGGGGSALGGLGNLGSLAGGLTGLSSLSTAFTAGSTSVGVMAGSIAGGGGLLGGAASALGAMGPIGWGLLAAGAAAALFGGKGGGPKTESGFGPNVTQRGDPAAAKAVSDGILQQYKAIAGDLAKNLEVGVFSATDPKGTAKTQLDVQALLSGQNIHNRAALKGGIENVGRSEQELAAAISEESSRVVLEALKATGLPDKIGDYLRQLGDIDQLSGGALDKAVKKVQKAMTERQTLEAQLFDLTHSELERSAAARAKERAAIEEENQAIYDHVTALTDLKAAEEQARSDLLSAYQTESDALRGVIDRHKGYALELRRVRDGLLTASDSPLSRSQRASLAGSRFDGSLSSAVAGNETALQDLGGTSKDFLDAIRSAARTPAEVAAAFAKVQAGLTTAAASADGRASDAQQQLDAMNQQLGALGLLNTTVLTVGQALSKYLDALNKQAALQSAIQQEQLNYAAAIAGQQNVTPTPVPATVTPDAALAIDQALINPATGLPYYMDNPGQNPNGFAAGGLPGFGAAMVGELGPEVVDFDTPGRVYTNDQTRGMFASNAELVPLLREVKTEIAGLRQDARLVDVSTLATLQKMESKFRKWDVDGLPAERVIA